MWLICGIAAAAMVQGYVLTWLARRLARRIGLLDRPDNGRKTHVRATPLLGGVAVYVTAALCAIEYSLLDPAAWGPGGDTGRVVLAMFVSGGLFCGLGLWDDKWGMRPWTKLSFQILAALPFVLYGQSIDHFILFGREFSLGWASLPLTLFALVLCTNAVNLLDGLDGVAGSVGIVVSATVAVVALMTDQAHVAAVAVILAGATAGFLIHNWPPAKIFLGDSGSLTIGFFLGALAIEGTLKRATGLTLALPLVLLSIPGFDTLMAIVRRVLSGRGIGQGDRAHLHHCLQRRGLSGVQVLLTIASMCVAMGLAVIGSVYSGSDFLAVAMCANLLLLLIVARVFGYNETALLLRRLQVFGSAAAGARGARNETLRDCVRSFSPAQRLDVWCRLCEHVRRQEAFALELICRDNRKDIELARLQWTAGHGPIEDVPVWQLCCSVQPSEGIRTTVVASGRRRADAGPPRLDELLEVLGAFCARWPAEPHRAEVEVAKAAGPRRYGPLPVLRPCAAAQSIEPVAASDEPARPAREAA